MSDNTGFPVFSEDALRERASHYLREAERERLLGQIRPRRPSRRSALGALLRTWAGQTTAGSGARPAGRATAGGLSRPSNK